MWVCALLMCECMLKKSVLLVPADMIKLNSVSVVSMCMTVRICGVYAAVQKQVL